MIEFKRKLPTFQAIKDMYPISAEMAERKQNTDSAVKSVLAGEDDRLLLVIGPCSADREDAVLEYASRLRVLQEEVGDRLLLVPRVYSNKPRTTGEGYKGMLHQPDPNARPDMLKGLISIRKMHMKVLEQTGFSTADEMLYPENHFYLSDVLSYVTVGARSVENQQHRLVSSGLDVAVGMKNPTGGDLDVMLNSISAASTHHTFVYNGWEVHTGGNSYVHAILRGGTDADGNYVPNYGYDCLAGLSEMLAEEKLTAPAVMIDTNHANSGKHWEKQSEIAADVLGSAERNADIKRIVKGFMIESYLVDGCQRPGGDVFGQSITDGCLGWEKTKELVYRIAEKC
ncbi:MAG: 3-deoxy-7-phosphoheptulonate synthase [Eubacteriales bacterium]|nr:3-deoxy-7-phosphoheptulonate synthase [Eubacteriales bacterium]